MGEGDAAKVESVSLGASDPPPAGPPPGRRARDGSLVGGAYAILTAGVVLLVFVVVAPADGIDAALTALAGAITIALGSALIAEVLSPRLVGLIAMPTAVVIGLSALIPNGIGSLEVGRLLAGAILFLGAAGVLSAAAQRARAGGGDRSD